MAGTRFKSIFRRAVPCAKTRFSGTFLAQLDKSSSGNPRNLREDALLGNAGCLLQAPFPGRLPEAMEDCLTVVYARISPR